MGNKLLICILVLLLLCVCIYILFITIVVLSNVVPEIVGPGLFRSILNP